jgi:hypothetical protein
MRKLLRLGRHRRALAILSGLVLIIAGVALVFAPAALVLAGVGLIVLFGLDFGGQT